MAFKTPLCVNHVHPCVSGPCVRAAQNVGFLPAQVGTREKHVHHDHSWVPHEESVLEVRRPPSAEIQLVCLKRSQDSCDVCLGDIRPPSVELGGDRLDSARLSRVKIKALHGLPFIEGEPQRQRPRTVLDPDQAALVTIVAQVFRERDGPGG